jgi:hypothetical protein
MKELKVTFKRIGMRKDNVTPYYQISFGQYMETLPTGQKLWHAGTSIFVDKATYDSTNINDMILIEVAA